LAAALIKDGGPKLKTGQPIENIEKKLDVTIPLDYKEFLETYGWLGIGDVFIFGFWKDQPDSTGGATIHSETPRLRKDAQMLTI
jgi:hypothetical protein